ncbi:MAG TPA: ABC transporter ATP-binding protein [Gammaproteobacteria bacterium]|nr:ABC transporter ATP-binding protein [Gammaproteobacteria bacterium]
MSVLNDQNDASPWVPVIEINDLVFGYDQPLLNIDHFVLAQSESIAVLGPSGCGKTTFMHLLTGLLRPNSGSIRINGTEITTLSESLIDRLRGQHIGIVFQRLHLVPSITVIENLLLAQRLARKSADRPYAITLLEQLDIADLINKKPGQLSQGQAQRVAIARAVVHRPQLLVADEPTSALDDQNAKEALTLLTSLTASTGAALMVVTHDERVRSLMNRTHDLVNPA